MAVGSCTGEEIELGPCYGWGDEESKAKEQIGGEDIEDCPTDLKGSGQTNLIRFLLKIAQGDAAIIWGQVGTET